MIFRRQPDYEAETVKAVLEGDPKAARAIYNMHVGYLTAVCSRYVTDDEDVKDLLQESFVKIFRSLDRFRYRGKGSLRAWMTRIVVNEALKFLRDKGQGRNSMVELKEYLPETADEDSTVDDADVSEIPPEEMQKMIRRLPVQYRTVFNLYVFQQMSHKEIASALGMAPATSASCLHRARKMLVQMVNEYRHERDV